MDRRRILEEIAWRAALDLPQAERALAATMTTLGERLLPLDASFLAAQLPEELATYLRERERPGDFDLDELYRRVAEREGSRPEFGREHAVVVCRVVARHMGRGPREALRSRLPEDFAELLTPPPRAERGPPAARMPRAREGTLATGRPGSRRPLFEATADRTQTQSVAASENPHADTKLSSTRGISSEREGRTLATARPRPPHPIAEED
jgi:uncharacterized protein (DUF2267 family)